jgi:hypothetical protein
MDPVMTSTIPAGCDITPPALVNNNDEKYKALMIDWQREEIKKAGFATCLFFF